METNVVKKGKTLIQKSFKKTKSVKVSNSKIRTFKKKKNLKIRGGGNV